ACAAFVAAARAGRPPASAAAEQMPEADAARMSAALDLAWEELHPPAEAAAKPERVKRERRAGWLGRKLMPVVAFAVLASLAGVSIFYVEDDAAPRPSAAAERADSSADVASDSEV